MPTPQECCGRPEIFPLKSIRPHWHIVRTTQVLAAVVTVISIFVIFVKFSHLEAGNMRMLPLLPIRFKEDFHSYKTK